MSLNWNIAEVKDFEELFQGEGDERRLDGLTEAFIFTSMVTGLGKGWSLDEAFAPEFYARIKLLEQVNGRLAYRPDGKGGVEDWLVTPEDVQRRIGLHVNVGPVSRAAFIKNVVTRDLDDAKRRYERAVEKAKSGS